MGLEELIKITQIPVAFEDNRGKILQPLNGERKDITHIAYLETHHGKIRGNHAHEKKYEFFYIIEGRLQCIAEDIETKKRVRGIVKAGALLGIPPNIAHAFKALEETKMLEFSPQALNRERPDVKPYEVMI